MHERRVWAWETDRVWISRVLTLVAYIWIFRLVIAISEELAPRHFRRRTPTEPRPVRPPPYPETIDLTLEDN